MNELMVKAGNAIRGVDDVQKQSVIEMRVANDKKKQLMAELVEDSRKRAGEDAKATKDAQKEKEKAWDDLLRSMKETYAMLNAMAVSAQDIEKRLAPSLKKSLPTEHVDGFNNAMKGAREAADEAFAAIMRGEEPSVGTFDRLRSKVRLSGVSLEQMARTTLDAASAFGVLDDSTARALQSAISLGVAVTKLATGTGGAQDIASAISSSASLISQMIGGDAARKKLIADNTAALDRVRKGLDAMSLDVSGETFAKTQAALASVIDVIKGGRGAKNQADVLAALKAQGLGMSDLKKVADELGIKIFSDSGALSVDGLKALFEAMGLVNLGTFGQSYSSQRDATLQGFDITGADALAQIAQLGSLGGQFSQLLAGVVDTQDLTGTRAKLAQLFERMKAGGFTAQQLGGLTSAEFLQFITDLISRIDQVGPTGGVPAPSGGIITAGDITMPGTVVSDTQNAAALSVATLLSEANAFASRTADAVEDSAKSLRSIDGKMDAVLDVLAGGMGAIDASLARANRMASLEAGTVPVLR